VAFGPRNLIEAVANGKRAARSIHEFLSPHAARLDATLQIETLPTSRYRMLAGFEVLDRETPPTLDVGRRQHRRGGSRIRRGRRPPASRKVPGVSRSDDLRPGALLRAVQPVRRHLPEYCLALVPFEALELHRRAARGASCASGGRRLPLAAMIKDDERCIRWVSARFDARPTQ
jgi:hypothetical protein